MIPPAEIKELTFKDYLDILRRHVWIIAAFLVIIPTIVAFRDFTTPKTYAVSVKLLIEKELPKVTGKEEKSNSPVRESQLALLQSKIVAEKVVKKLNLMSDEDFIGSNDPVSTILTMLSVNQAAQSDVVYIRFTGQKPLKIAVIANTWAKEFIDADVEQRSKNAKKGLGWIQEQLDDTLKKLQLSEKKLNDFLESNKIVALPNIGEEKETLVESLKAQKSELEKQIIEASKRYGEKHPRMASLETQLEAVNRKIQEEKDTLFALQDKTLEYKVLKRDVDTYKSLYNDLLGRIRDLEISKEMVSSNIQVLEEAQPPTVPIKPQPKKDILQAIVISLLLGLALSYFLEHLDSTLKTSEDVEFYTKLPFLGYIPSAKKELKSDRHTTLISNSKPFSRVAEALRNLRVSLIFSFPEDKPLRTLMITSSIAGEGKSFVAANLAIIFAQTNEEILLIDADMRKGKLARTFECDAKNGLSSVLAGICTMEEAIMPTAVPNLSLLTSGPYTPNPTELLSSDKFNDIVEKAKAKYKRVILDAPPILSVADPLIIGGKCDGMAFVIRAGFTSLKFITDAKRIFENKTKTIGAVLNNVEIERDRYYYYHYYSYAPESKK